MIPQYYIDEVLARTDIVSIIDQRVKLKKAGKNHTGLCPFHDEKSPSFSVTEQKQFAYCFGCGWSGSAIRFIQDFERIPFQEAVKKLAMLAGMQPPDKATKQQLMTAEVKKITTILRDERLIIEIGNAMMGRGETLPDDEIKRIELAKQRVAIIKNKLEQMGYCA